MTRGLVQYQLLFLYFSILKDLDYALYSRSSWKVYFKYDSDGLWTLVLHWDNKHTYNTWSPADGGGDVMS